MAKSIKKIPVISGVMPVVIFTLIFLLIFLNFNPNAAAQSSATIELGKVEGFAGKEAIVPVYLKNSSGTAGGEFVLTFDPDIVEPVDASSTELLEEAILMPNLKYAADSLKIVWAAITPVKADGEIATIKFFLKKEGESALELKEPALSSAEPGDISVTGVNGSILSRPSEGANSGSSDKAAKPEGKDSDSAGKTQPGDDGIPAREGPAVLTVERVRGRAGETIKVIVKVENPRGMSGGNMVLAYNPGVVEPVKVKPGNLLDGLIPVSNLKASENTISIAWFGLKGKTSDGALLEISFRLKEKGKSPLEIKELSLVNSEAEEIPVESADGQIVILAAGSLLSALPDYVVSHYLYFLGAAVIILIVVIFIIFHRRRKKRAVL